MFAKPNAEKRPGFLKRLRKDQSGNTVALMAAGLIPLTGMIGSGIDISRVYLVKTRLQQACDAGALAARKRMGSDVWSPASNTVAENMFDANFSSGTSGSVALTKSYSEAGGIVTGEASVDVPMVVMDIFGKEKSSIDVQCQAQLAVPNTDVMFVLDTTGSMNCPDTALPTECSNNNNVEVSNSKIVGLRLAVRCFYEALSKQDSEADCGSTPSGVTQTAQTRFGFVPYTSNVNVGKLLPNEYLTDTFTYQSRVPVLAPVWVYSLGSEGAKTYGAYSNPATPSSPNTSYVAFTPTGTTSTNVTLNGTPYPTVLNVSATQCPGRAKPNPYTITATTPNDSVTGTNTAPPVHPGGEVTTSSYPYRTFNSRLTQTRYFYEWVRDTSGSARRCRLRQATYTASSYDRVTTASSSKPVAWTKYTDTFTNWQYRPVSFTVSGLKNGGSSWNNSIQLPVNFTTQTLNVSGTNGMSVKRATNMTANWDGCIEERETVRTTDFDPLPDANDLNVDMLPTSTASTQWAPHLPAAVWGRYSGANTTSTVSTSSNLWRNQATYNDNSDGDNSDNFDISCPLESRIPTQWADADAFDGYVEDLTGYGGTYHDIGLIWGARLLSPTGLFAENNTNRQNIQRHMVFMTDGATSTNETIYGAYGIEWWDRRRTPTGTDPNVNLLNEQVNNRFLAMCEYIKNDMRITLWVVAFGTGITTQAQANMDSCASPGKSLTAINNAALLTEFRGIADEISDLRLTN